MLSQFLKKLVALHQQPGQAGNKKNLHRLQITGQQLARFYVDYPYKQGCSLQYQQYKPQQDG